MLQDVFDTYRDYWLQGVTRPLEATPLLRAVSMPRPGEMVEGEGIFLGQYKSSELSKTFNVFAAPTDLTDDRGALATFTYQGAVERLAVLENWHGHRGRGYTAQLDLHKAMENGAYKGEWTIPPVSVLCGTALQACDARGRPILSNSLHAHRRTGAFDGTFASERERKRFIVASLERAFPDWYWSCTTNGLTSRAAIGYYTQVFFSSGKEPSTPSHPEMKHSCRPVRFVPVKPA